MKTIVVYAWLLASCAVGAQAQPTLTVRFDRTDSTFAVVDSLEEGYFVEGATREQIKLRIENPPSGITVGFAIVPCGGGSNSGNAAYDEEEGVYVLPAPSDGKVERYTFDIVPSEESIQSFHTDLFKADDGYCGEKPPNEVAGPCLSAGYRFLPAGEDYAEIAHEARILKQMREESDTTAARPKNVQLVYDWLANEMTLHRPEPGLWEKFLSAVGSDRYYVRPREFVSVRVVNINPYVYTVEVDDAVVNRHTEGRAAFEQALAGEPVGEQEEADPATIQSGVASSDAFATLRTAACLAPELAAFYQRKRTARLADMDLLQVEIERIGENIQQVLGIQPPNVVSSATILARGAELLAQVERRNVGPEVIALARDYAAQVRKGAELYRDITGIEYTTRSVPVQPGNNDVLQFTLTIEDDQEEVASETYDIPIHGGWKVDFSTGLYLTGLRDFEYGTRDTSIVDTTYFVGPDFVRTDSITAIDTTTGKLVFQQDEGDFDLGIGASAHFYYRTRWPVNVGLTLGVITTTDVEARFLLGPSLILGRDQRFIFSGGWAVGRVDRLSSDLRVGGLWTGSSSAVPTRETAEVDWWFGLTYNFTAPKSAGGAD